MSADAILSTKYKKTVSTRKQSENSLREVVSTRKVYGGKMTYFSGSTFFVCFEKHPKFFSELYGTVFGPEAFSGLLRNARQLTNPAV